MKVSLNWLNDYVDLSGLSAEQVAQAFTSIGLEAEGIDKQSVIGEEVVVGEVLTAVKHPNADQLRLCTVAVGEAEPLAIVCGAPNARPGIKVVVAKVGATLPGDFKIKKSKIRGEVSNGMLCSEKELQLSENHEGIIELPEAAKVGQSAAAALNLGDTVIELNVTPNRADCLGMVGLARDLAAKLKRQLKRPDLNSGRRDATLHSNSKISVKISDEEGCSRFVALLVESVKPIPAPGWMQKRLTAAGMRPINLLVDATNYAMLEYAQPVHAYDLRSINGNVIEVRRAKESETLVTLDGQERRLATNDLLIADAKGPLGLAGIMGGQTSEVRPDTSQVVIEVARFSPTRIRKTARRLGLHSEASHRFERGVDVDNLQTVAFRVADLISQGLKDQGTVRVASEAVDLYPADTARRVIALRVSFAKQFLGLPSLTKDEVSEILARLDFELLDSTDDRLLFEVPYFRGDIEREVDLVEEVARMLGFERIPYSLPVMSLRTTPEDPMTQVAEKARFAAAGIGFNETISFPFVGSKEARALGLDEQHPLYPTLALANPLSDEHSFMQTSLISGLARALQTNRRHGSLGARLFEAGRGYFDKSRLDETLTQMPALKSLGRPSRLLGQRARSDSGRPLERHWLAGVMDQPLTFKSWHAPLTPVTFFHGKAAVLGILGAFGLADEVLWQRPEPKVLPFLHPGAGAALQLHGKFLGYLGELHPRAALALDLTDGSAPPVFFELDLEVILDALGKRRTESREPQRFPPVTRDVAFLVDKKTEHGDFLAAVNKFKGKQNLARFRLFDVYEGEKLPPNKKSMAYAFAFQSMEKTLTDQEVESELTRLVQWLGEAIGATQRA